MSAYQKASFIAFTAKKRKDKEWVKHRSKNGFPLSKRSFNKWYKAQKKQELRENIEVI